MRGNSKELECLEEICSMYEEIIDIIVDAINVVIEYP